MVEEEIIPAENEEDEDEIEYTVTLKNKKGEVILALDYALGDYYYMNGLRQYANSEKQVGMIDEKGRIVIEAKYEYLTAYSDGLISFLSGDYYGAINRKGKEVITAKYAKELVFVGGFSYAVKDGYVGVVNKNGQEIVEIKYDSIKTLGDTLTAEVAE